MEGEYYIESGEWYSSNSNKSINNPLIQLERNKSMIQQVFNHYRINLPIKAYTIFPNPNFTLFQSSRDLPIILPTQIIPFINQMNKITSLISKDHMQIAERLLSLTVDKSRYLRVPEYDYPMLKKGIICEKCEQEMMSPVARHLVCPSCGHIESIVNGVMRNVRELKMLFPEMKITSAIVLDWCGLDSVKCIRRILMMNYEKIGRTSGTFYVEK
ncbi:NERD domain-containing protein [Bacillus tamaricis]|uniref:NERD domain-containing protein n=2 Tax=Evansella tamaricis TaxID=2069301 RepID=A0ABS6JN89_9BACI|nr:NERD domain-containing protein [Evansella tamaricis]